MRKILLLIPLIGGFFNLQAYYFGKNKVQYRDFDWQIVTTEHFKIFVLPEEKHLVPFASSVLESTFTEYVHELHINKLNDKIPVLIYPSPNSFKQTNVTLDIIEEFTGGFTEVMKNRVVVPFNGSYLDFQHVLRHELVHVFQFHIFFKGIRTYYIPPFTMSIPLWVMEGMAEYFSWGGWSPDAEMFMRDLVLNDKVIPIEELAYYGGWIIYKEGQAIFCFLNDVYGPEKTREFIYQLKMSGNVDKAFKKVTGKTAVELNEEFSIYLKKKFYPSVEEFDLPESSRKIELPHGESFLNFGVLSPDGGRIALISDISGYTDIYIVSVFDGEIERKLVSGEKSPSFENLHLVRPGLDFSDDGKYLVFVGNRGGYDAIYIYNVNNGKKVREIRPEELIVYEMTDSGEVATGKLPIEAVYEPSFSPDGQKIVFVGIQKAVSDIYMYDFKIQKLHRLTNNLFDERTPVFSKEGSEIYFLSDACGESWDGHFGSYAIFSYSLTTGKVKRLSPHYGNINFLTQLNDSLLGFIGLYRGANNVLAFSISSGEVYQVTNFPTDMKLVSSSSDFSELGLSLMWEGQWSYFVIPTPEKGIKPINYPETPLEFVKLDRGEHLKSHYKTKFSVDWIQGNLVYATSLGFSGWMTIGLSDELGNHRISIATDRYSGNTNFYFQYANLTHRTDLYASVFHYWSYGFIDYFSVFRERNIGVSTGLTYPFSKFSRIDLDVTFKHPTRYVYEYDENLGMFLLSDIKSYNSVEITGSYVLDRALYSFWGPLSGDRGAIEFHTEFLTPFKYSYALFDYRRYSRTIPRYSTMAFRFMGGMTYGEQAPKFWLGGYNTLRGYYPYEFSGNNFVLFNAEWRVPFIDTLKIAFPIPLTFSGIRGVLFFDAGAVDLDKGFRPFERQADGYLAFKDIKADIGYGFRIYIAPGVALRFDFAKKYNIAELKGQTMYYFSIDWDY